MSQKIRCISFTLNGYALAERIKEKLSAEYDVEIFSKCREHTECIEESVGEWTRRYFEKGTTLIYVGALGIAVRAIAPCVKDKLSDAAVVVVDEQGKYCIPALSGHMGGANELARRIAAVLGAEPVITTATDIRGAFAVDMFAKKNGLHILQRDGIAKCSARLLANEQVKIFSEKKIGGRMPNLLLETSDENTADVVISPYKKEAILNLIPKCIRVGIGCKRGKSVDEIKDVFYEALGFAKISVEATASVSSIELKKDELGIIGLSQDLSVPFLTFSAQELSRVQGSFKPSDFVKEKVGVDNVCGRAAIASCKNGGKILVDKYAKNGVTIAIAEEEWVVSYEYE